MASKKITNKSKKDSNKKKNIKNNKLFNEVIGLVILFIGIFSIYSLTVNNSGTVGNILNFILKLIFSKGSYLIAISFMILGVYTMAKNEEFKIHIKIISLILIIINYCIFETLREGLVISNPFSMETVDTAILLINKGGGLIGIFLASLFIKLFSDKGTIILLILSTIISTLILTEKSIFEIFDNLIIKIKGRRQKELSIKPKTTPIKKTKDNNIKQLDKKIKILDYSEIRGQKNKEDNIKEDITTKKETKKSQQQKKQIDKKINELEKKTEKGPLVEAKDYSTYIFPPINLLKTPQNINLVNNKREVLNNAKTLEKTLNDFGVRAKIIEVSMGPTVTRYELQPEPGIKVSKIVNLSNDIALSLATSGVRIEAPIPGKAAVGIEVPNKDIATVNIREIIESNTFSRHQSKLCFAIGKQLSGNVMVGDLAKMPHLLIAGATGSGKSVCINGIIISLLYKSSPEEVKLILIDPKMVELNNYNGIPHLLIPVVTDPKQASGALNWAIKEMTERYKLFKDNHVRDITRYNEVMKEKNQKLMPKIVIIIDELADLMMVAPNEVENAICRLAQLARAAGIHLILATQRPSVDVITGLIKANIPSRISFAVSSMTDSRTILDMGGAEKLLGRGDMLYYPVGEAKPMRLQGTFISDKEVESIVKFVRNQGSSNYNSKVIEQLEKVNTHKQEDENIDDEMLPKAIELAFENQKISTSMIQRKLRVGYARAGRLVDSMETKGIISGPEGSKPRKVLITRDEYFNNEENDEDEQL